VLLLDGERGHSWIKHGERGRGCYSRARRKQAKMGGSDVKRGQRKWLREKKEGRSGVSSALALTACRSVLALMIKTRLRPHGKDPPFPLRSFCTSFPSSPRDDNALTRCSSLSRALCFFHGFPKLGKRPLRTHRSTGKTRDERFRNLGVVPVSSKRQQLDVDVQRAKMGEQKRKLAGKMHDAVVGKREDRQQALRTVETAGERGRKPRKAPVDAPSRY
jgi:hypothetical protein